MYMNLAVDIAIVVFASWFLSFLFFLDPYHSRAIDDLGTTEASSDETKHEDVELPEVQRTFSVDETWEERCSSTQE